MEPSRKRLRDWAAASAAARFCARVRGGLIVFLGGRRGSAGVAASLDLVFGLPSLPPSGIGWRLSTTTMDCCRSGCCTRAITLLRDRRDRVHWGGGGGPRRRECGMRQEKSSSLHRNGIC